MLVTGNFICVIYAYEYKNYTMEYDRIKDRKLATFYYLFTTLGMC